MGWPDFESIDRSTPPKSTHPDHPPIIHAPAGDETTPEQQRGAYEALLLALRPAQPKKPLTAEAANDPMDTTTITEAEVGSEAEAEAKGEAVPPSPMEPPQFLEPRVVGMACELLGRHAATVPAMSAEALTALVRRRKRKEAGRARLG